MDHAVMKRYRSCKELGTQENRLSIETLQFREKRMRKYEVGGETFSGNSLAALQGACYA